MSYVKPAESKDIVGIELTQSILDIANSIINQWTEYRWEETNDVKYFSGNARDYIFYINSPVQSITSVVVDDTTLTVDTEYEIRNSTGRLKILTGIEIGNDNVVVTYKYGFPTTHYTFKAVKGAEAEIALYLKKNPSMGKTIGWNKFNLLFQDAHIKQFLAFVPQKFSYQAL